MKLKPYKEKQPVSKLIKDIYSFSQEASPTSINIDVDGCITLENFKKLLDYNDTMIALETRDKTVYIYGEELTVITCNKYNATVCGEILKIEIFSKEVR